MKTIAVIAMEKEYAKLLMNNLNFYLSNYAEFHYYSLAEVKNKKLINEDFIVIATFTIYDDVKRCMSNLSKLIVVNVIPNRKKIKTLFDLPVGTRALLVNFDYRTCIQCITNLYGIGLNHLDLIPYYGTGSYDTTITLAITPNEERLVPQGIKKVINIGESVIDYNCLCHIANYLGVEDIFIANEGIYAKSTGYFSNYSMEKILGENESLTEKIILLMELMEQGIIITNVVGNIYTCNKKAQVFLKYCSEVLIGFNIFEILPEIALINPIKNKMEFKDELIRIGKINLIVSAVQIAVDDQIHGYIITLEGFEEVEEKQHKIRTRMNSLGHKAKYTFSDIIGSSSAMCNTIEIAKRMSKSESSIMITGESGTGKEIFAQSIHNKSSRKNYNFVAVNCAAIPENLLESEMFGYEEGAFTGARKGGSVGYFELAHKGTIFFDEISEIPLPLQSKLLRVVEERNVSKVGANTQFYVDVRIICASNKDLFKLVEKNEFREDLYYRLSVLPLHIPSLKERKSDIWLIVTHFIKQLGVPIFFTPEAKNFLMNYGWRGNVREVRNTIEYLCNLDKKKIDVPDLAFLQRSKVTMGNISLDSMKQENISLMNKYEKNFIFKFGHKVEIFKFILDELLKAKNNNEFSSRLKLFKISMGNNLMFSEGEIKGAMRNLNEFDFINSGKGRRGTTITEKGVKLYNTLSSL